MLDYKLIVTRFLGAGGMCSSKTRDHPQIDATPLCENKIHFYRQFAPSVPDIMTNNFLGESFLEIGEIHK